MTKVSELMRLGQKTYNLPQCRGHSIVWNGSNEPCEACAYGNVLLGIVALEGIDMSTCTNFAADMRIQPLTGCKVHFDQIIAPETLVNRTTSVFGAITYLNDTLKMPVLEIADWLEKRGF